MNEIVRRWHGAAAIFNGDFYRIETLSGYRSGHADPKGAQHFLSLAADDEALGDAVLDALSMSRFVLAAPREGSVYPPDLEFDWDLYDLQKATERSDRSTREMIRRYGYATERALFKNMRFCSVYRRDTRIEIGPTRHEKLEAWGRTKGDGIEDVVISANSTPAEIGAALRLGFSRCLD